MDKYIKLKKLGSGSFGHIYLVRNTVDSQLYVLKSIDLKSLTKQQRKDAVKEIQILAQFSCPYIIRYKEYFYSNVSPDSIPTAQKPSAYDSVAQQQQKQRSLNVASMDNYDLSQGSILYIIMEYADGGDLDQRIKANRSKQLFSEQYVLTVWTQCAIALHDIHKKHIIHRDIKSENIFLMKSGDIKLGDFGISKSLQNTLAQAQTRIGTPYYLSPEICLNKPYSYKTDVWSLGVVLYELLTMAHPFDGSSMENLLKNIVKTPYTPVSKTYSSELRKLLDSCLQKTPDKRPTIAQILKNPLLQPYIKLYAPASSDAVKASSRQSIDTVVHRNNENSNTDNKKPIQTHLPAISAAMHQQPQQQQQQQQLPPQHPSHYVLHSVQQQQQPIQQQISPRMLQQQYLQQQLQQQQHAQPQHRPPLTVLNRYHVQQPSKPLTPVEQSRQQLNRLKEQQRLHTLAAARNSSPNKLQQKREQERQALEAELAQIRAKYMAEQTARYGAYSQQNTYTRYGRTPQVQATSRYATPSVQQSQYGIAAVHPPARKHHFVV